MIDLNMCFIQVVDDGWWLCKLSSLASARAFTEAKIAISGNHYVGNFYYHLVIKLFSFLKLFHSCVVRMHPLHMNINSFIEKQCINKFKIFKLLLLNFISNNITFIFILQRILFINIILLIKYQSRLEFVFSAGYVT